MSQRQIEIESEKPHLPKVVAQYLGSLPRMYDTHDLSVLDTNCGRGSSCIAFVKRGYGIVGGVAQNAETLELARASQTAQRISHRRLLLRENIAKVEIDAGRSQFDLVLANEAFYGKVPAMRQSMVHHVKQLTAPGGINLVSGFVYGSAHKDRGIRPDKFLRQNELTKYYSDPDWLIDYVQEETTMQVPSENGFAEIPISTMIARKRS